MMQLTASAGEHMDLVNQMGIWKCQKQRHIASHMYHNVATQVSILQ